jgi:AraC-like DNA-binding protein
MTAVDPDALPVQRVAELDLQREQDRWLIEGLWGRSAIGLIGGAPKCCKTWMGLDLAISVASGTAALGHFAVHATGPALIYLAEDGLPQVRARIESLCRHRGLALAGLDLHVITAPVLRLDLACDQQRLARTLDQLRPILVLLDPLVRMHRLDENSAAEISGLLGYIRDLQRTYDVAVVLVHHASKKQRSQPGQALRGSSDLHAIGDSNLYLARTGEHIVLTIEHRAASSPDPMPIELVAAGNTPYLRLCRRMAGGGQVAHASLDQQVLDLLAQNAGLSRTELRARLRVNNQRLGDCLTQLERQRRIRRTATGWRSAESCSPTLPGETEAGSAGVQPAKG